MSDSSFTLLEVHLGDGDIEIGPFELLGASDDPADIESGAAAIASDSADADANADGDASDAGSGCGCCSARSVAGLLLALAALAAVAVGVAKLRGDDEVPSGIAGDD